MMLSLQGRKWIPSLAFPGGDFYLIFGLLIQIRSFLLR
jgi:hypothetical protein